VPATAGDFVGRQARATSANSRRLFLARNPLRRRPATAAEVPSTHFDRSLISDRATAFGLAHGPPTLVARSDEVIE